MRVLFTSTGGLGHVNPLLPLAHASRARGDDVIVVAADPGATRARAAGFEVVEAGLAERDAQAELARRWPEVRTMPGSEKPTFVFQRLFGAVAAPHLHPALRRIAHEWCPDVIVHDAAELAAPVVAAELGVPNACHSFGLAVPASRVQSAADHAAGLWLAAGLEPRPFGGCYDHVYIDIYPPSMQPDDLSHLGRIVRRRPESDAAARGEALPPAVAIELADHPDRPLVHVTFGTVYNDNAAFAAAVEGVARLDATVLVTVGPGGDVRAFGEPPSHVHVHEYVAQRLALPRTAALVSHAGSGTMLAALGYGIPQLCVPQAADQFRNAHAIETAGAGLCRADGDLTADAVEQDVRMLLHDDRVRDGARRVAAEIAEMPSAVDVAEELRALAGG